MPRSTDFSSTFTASYNRQTEWRQCCAIAMGFEWVDDFNDNNNEDVEDSSSKTQTNPNARIQQIINLMEDEEEDDDHVIVGGRSHGHGENGNDEGMGRNNTNHHHLVDPWMANAFRMQTDIHEMSKWIQMKKHDYIGLGMNDEEASLIQSTVTTFAATTAAELETLRKLILTSTSQQSSQQQSQQQPSGNSVGGHRQGIVQILLHQLQEQITQPFSILQKQRTRPAVQLWQNPWHCHLSSTLNENNRTRNHMDDDGDNNMDNNNYFFVEASDKRFMTLSTLMIPQEDFLEKYQRDPIQHRPPRPAFFHQLSARKLAIQTKMTMTTRDDDNDDVKASPSPTSFSLPTATANTTTKNTKGFIQRIPVPMNEEVPNFEEQMEEEAMLLQETIVRSDLDSVQKMEQRMVEITTLIGQFSNLVSEQQEDIMDIAQHAQETKQNMTKGQENLIDATQRTQKSKHYLAWTIFGLSLTLLFFHTLRN